MNRLRLCVAAAGFTLACAALAAQTGIPTWDELTLRGQVHGEPITVVVRSSGGRLTGLSTDTLGIRIDVPAAELSDLAQPRLNEVQILYGMLPPAPPGAVGERPYHSVRLPFGEPAMLDGAPHFHEAIFVFWDGRYRERWVRRVEGKDAWRYEIKKPGQAPETAGPQSVIGGSER